MLLFRACRVHLERGEYIRSDGSTGPLTENEVALLQYLAERGGQVVGREELQVGGLGYRPGVRSRAVDHAIARLRKKVEVDPSDPEHLITVYGVGYRLDGVRPVVHAEHGFVGRVRELARLDELAKARSVVTVWGPGGVGKTRLVREYLREREAVSVDLALAADPHDVLGRLGATLGVPLTGGAREAQIGQIGRVLATRDTSLVFLDNAEHVADDLAGMVTAWSALSPDTCFLVASRCRLQVPGEASFELPPLSEGEAMALFAALARRQRPDYRLEPGAEATVRRLVDRLDRLPLAVELAASRAGLLSTEALLQRVSDDLDEVRGPEGPARWQTLRGAIAWSWTLLDDHERSAFAQASVFAGPFDAEAWEGVVRVPGRSVLDLLDDLLSHALVHREQAGDEVRFHLLVTLREYAARRLETHPEADSVRHRHAAWYLARAEERAGLPVRGDLTWHRQEKANLLSAYRAMRASRPRLAARLALALDSLLEAVGPPGQRRRLLEESRDLAGGDRGLRAEVRWRLADAWRKVGDLEGAWSEAEAALDDARAVRDRTVEATALLTLGTVRLSVGALGEAAALFREALAGHREAGNRRKEAVTLYNLGNVLQRRGRYDEAEASFRQALEVIDVAEDPSLRVAFLSGLAMLLREVGRLDAARFHLERAREGPAGVNVHYRLYALHHLGHVHLAAGDLEQAAEVFLETERAARQVGDQYVLPDALDGRGLVASEQGRHVEAQALFDAARSLYRELGRSLYVDWTDTHAGVDLLLAGVPSEARVRLEAACRRRSGSTGAHRAEACGWLALALAATGEQAAARERLREAADLAGGQVLQAAVVLWGAALDRLAGGCGPPAGSLADARALQHRSQLVRLALQMAERLAV